MKKFITLFIFSIVFSGLSNVALSLDTGKHKASKTEFVPSAGMSHDVVAIAPSFQEFGDTASVNVSEQTKVLYSSISEGFKTTLFALDHRRWYSTGTLSYNCDKKLSDYLKTDYPIKQCRERSERSPIIS